MKIRGKILIICVVVVVVVGIVTAWYFSSQPQLVLSLKYQKPLILFGGLLVNASTVETLLPEPLDPYIPPTVPDKTILRIGFGPCHVTTAKGSASTFLVFLSGNINGSSVSQATEGKLDFFVQEFVYKIYVDNQEAAGLLSDLGLPVELTEIDFDSSTIESRNLWMLIVSNEQDICLNMTLSSEPTPVTTTPPEPQRDIDFKIGWVFGKEGNIKALRFKRDHNNGANIYTLIEGTLKVSSSSPIYQVIGGTTYDIAETLQQYYGSQGRVLPVLNGGESHYVYP